MTALVERVRARLAAGDLDLPPLGAGDTAHRWFGIYAIARHDAAEARLAEPHVDAVQILREAGRDAPTGSLWGVWASDHPAHRVTLSPGPTADRLRLQGTKGFCGGAGLVDHALVTATHAATGEHLLVAVPLVDLPPDRIDTSAWATPALAETCTATVDLAGVTVAEDAVVGPARWYLDRPGFWAGALGPAACWAGAAAGLVDHAEAHPPPDPHGRAHLGALRARRWELEAVLERSGHQIDTGSAAPEARRRLALTVRHLVDVAAADVVDRFARSLGPRHLAGDAAVARRIAAIELWRRQCHAERDLEVLGDPDGSAPDG